MPPSLSELYTLTAQGLSSSWSRWCQAGRAKSVLFDFQLWNFAVILWVVPLNNCLAYRLLGRWEWFRVYGEQCSFIIKTVLLWRPGGRWQLVFSSPILIFLIFSLTSFFLIDLPWVFAHLQDPCENLMVGEWKWFYGWERLPTDFCESSGFWFCIQKELQSSY